MITLSNRHVPSNFSPTPVMDKHNKEKVPSWLRCWESHRLLGVDLRLALVQPATYPKRINVCTFENS